MILSKTQFDSKLTYWQDYLPFLQRLDGEKFPSCGQLNTLLPTGLSSEGRKPIQFVNSTELGDDAYEHRIYTTGKVSTRPDNWHDLFNALVWTRFPRIKLAMNALHFKAASSHAGPGRGPQRDALTLFDECGVIVFSKNLETLEALAKRDWQHAFVDSKASWDKDIQVAITGHAMLEKFLTPYKSMTAKAMLVQVDEKYMDRGREEILGFLDQEIALGILEGELMNSPGCLTPLPLAGIPGWWSSDHQDIGFYDDPQVFRPPPARLLPAPVFKL